MRVYPGLRVGIWKPGEYHRKPFVHLGFYDGPDLGDLILGKVMKQPLIEGDLRFSVGVLFRPDLGRSQRLETVLLIKTYVEEMWNYETWMKKTGD